MEARLREPLPEAGCDPELVLERALRDVLAPGLRVDHPRFFAFVPMPGNPVGAVADALAAGLNVFGGTWLGRRARRWSSWSWSTGCASCAACRRAPGGCSSAAARSPT